MSLIGKKPFVQEMFAAMTDEHLETLNGLINNLGEPEFVNFNEIGEANLGVHYVRLTFNELYMNSHFGFLIYVDNEHCGFFSFQDSFEEMKSVQINPVTHQYWYLQEHLTADEFRRALADALENGGSGPSGSSVNIITFSDVVLSDNVAELSITDEDWTKIQDTTKDCVVIIEYASGSKTALNRMTLSTSRAIFSSMRPYSDDQLEEVTATFIRSGMEEPYTYEGELEISYFEASGGLPVSTKADQVLVSNSEGGWDETKSVPLADNLLANPINNDSPYSYGPTGGLADITTGEEAYLQEIKGMSVVWNQLLDAEHNSYTCDASHIYAYRSGPNFVDVIQNSSQVITYSTGRKLFDLTLMFGSNDKIPFSGSRSDEYPINGTIPAQVYAGYGYGFQRLFANVDLANAPYDAGTIKNVKATKLVETGRNLWDASTMTSNGIQLLAGYRYEVYLEYGDRVVQISKDNGNTWETALLTRYQRADGKYIWTYLFSVNVRMKSYSRAITYVGFVHSGNYALTTGTNTGANFAYVEGITIPSYVKHEFDISGIDGLNGIGEVYDTKDMKRIESVDLSTLSSYMNYDSENEYWEIDASNLPSNMNLQAMFESSTYLYSNQNKYELDFNCDENNRVVGLWFYSNDGTNAPTGTLLYPLTEPVATSEPAFEPIALKSGDTWVVNDMGSEYFIQPANTNCPVNQVSYYYENLKDKLQNLQEPIEVAAASYDYSKSALNGLKIGDKYYRLVEQGYISARSDVAIGNNAGCYSSNCVSLGVSAQTNSYNNIAIGVNSNSNGTDSVAIGYQTRSVIPYGVCFDGPTSRTYHCYSPEKIFFRNDISNFNKNTFESYTLGHYLSEYVQNQTLVLQDGKYYISYTDANNFKTFSNNRISGTDNDITSTVKGVHLVVKLSNNNVASLDLLPYDSTNSQAFTAYGIASDTPTFVSAYIDSDGCVVITAPSGLTVSEALYTLR